MVRRTPAERYIAFLVLHPDRLDNNAIRAAVERRGLLWCSRKHVDGLRALCKPPRLFRPLDPKHRASRRFLEERGVFELFHPSPEVTAALGLTEQPRVQEQVESMIALRAPDDVVATALRSRFKLDTSADVIRAYRVYCFDPDLLDASELRLLLRRRLARAGHTGETARMDARLVASELPTSRAAVVLAQLRTGVLPRDLDLGPILQQASAVLACRIAEAAMRGGPGDAQAAAQLATAMRTVLDAAQNACRPEDRLLSTIATIQLEREDKTIPTLKELAGPWHTTDLCPREPERPD